MKTFSGLFSWISFFLAILFAASTAHYYVAVFFSIVFACGWIFFGVKDWKKTKRFKWMKDTIPFGFLFLPLFLFANEGGEKLLETPIWLGVIIIVVGYGINLLQKWVDVSTNGNVFSLKFWWATNKLNTWLSLLIILALLLVFPNIADGTIIAGSEEIGERVVYLLIGYAPMKIFKAVIPKQYQGGDFKVEDFR